MLVAPDGSFHGTIGGGTLEWRALALAQAGIAKDMTPVVRAFPLGPKLGQCCGGHVDLAFQTFVDAGQASSWAEREESGGLILSFSDDGAVSEERDALAAGGWVQRFGEDRTTLILAGAGHVGRALVLALAPLPFRILWTDVRAESFPVHVPTNVQCIPVQNPEEWLRGTLAQSGKGCFVLAMTHSHPLDLALVDVGLRSDAPAYVGVIGSQTKRARFLSRLASLGHSRGTRDRMVCPVGLPSLAGKEPAVIAASLAADLLIRREALAANAPVRLVRGHG